MLSKVPTEEGSRTMWQSLCNAGCRVQRIHEGMMLPVQIAGLRRRAERAEAELSKARRVIEVRGNVSALLEQLLGTEGASEPGSTAR